MTGLVISPKILGPNIGNFWYWFRTVLKFGFDHGTNVFGFCCVFWYHSDSMTNGTKKMVRSCEGTEMCSIFMGLRLGPFCVFLLD